MLRDREIIREINKCKKSPYYLAITYLTFENSKGEIAKYTTLLSEKEFNDYFKLLKK